MILAFMRFQAVRQPSRDLITVSIVKVQNKTDFQSCIRHPLAEQPCTINCTIVHLCLQHGATISCFSWCFLRSRTTKRRMDSIPGCLLAGYRHFGKGNISRDLSHHCDGPMLRFGTSYCVCFAATPALQSLRVSWMV